MTALIGIDAATKPRNIGLARGHVDAAKIVVEEVRLGSEIESIPETIGSWINEPTVIAIDAPLGWPAPMCALSDHQAGGKIEIQSDGLFSRLTDHTVHEAIGKKPLEVGANLIARAAVSALDLIQPIRERTGLPLPLLWESGRAESGIIEVYPAAALTGRGLSVHGYKKSDPTGLDARRNLVSALSKEIGMLPTHSAIEATDHALDAVLCLLTAADFLHGHVVPPSPAELPLARKEGWIWFRPLK